MRLVRWDPFRELVTVSDRLERGFPGRYTVQTDEASGTWVPPVDVFERQDQLVIRAEIPGVSRDDMDVSIEHGVLTLKGERKPDPDFPVNTARRTERVYGAFTRRFSLPATVDASKIAAAYKDGVLEVSVPKAESAKPKQVEIRAA